MVAVRKSVVPLANTVTLITPSPDSPDVLRENQLTFEGVVVTDHDTFELTAIGCIEPLR
jgi:hypothetical protein